MNLVKISTESHLQQPYFGRVQEGAAEASHQDEDNEEDDGVSP